MWYYLGAIAVSIVTASYWLYRHPLTSLKLLEFIFAKKLESVQAKHIEGNVYVISYQHNGQMYNLYLPIRSKVKVEFQGYDIYANINGDTFNLSQEPGVPYLVQPEDFGVGSKIFAICEHDDSCHVFEGFEEIRLLSTMEK